LSVKPEPSQRTLPIAGRFDPDARAYVFSAIGETELPSRFAVLAGEVIHHLRSCLDHVVTQLVRVEGGTPDHRTEFPICRTREAFEVAKQRGKVDGLSVTVLNQIEAAQPYRADPDPANSTHSCCTNSTSSISIALCSS
jgi:hypothetical protein